MTAGGKRKVKAARGGLRAGRGESRGRHRSTWVDERITWEPPGAGGLVADSDLSEQELGAQGFYVVFS
ncbi:hypothetical protein O3P69_003645 [Scylla paramamosain]|uniref:Uncharacterized protein n=1 Tax=Scylla paramamosain TaxID=85552 RepID=A0AAW0UKQ8_SCYPA